MSLLLGLAALPPRAQDVPRPVPAAPAPEVPADLRPRCSDELDRLVPGAPPVAQARCGGNAHFGLPDAPPAHRDAAVDARLHARIAAAIRSGA